MVHQKRKSKKRAAKFDGFMLNHFADDVTYDASKFLAKNMEAVHPDTAKMLQKSNYEMAKQIGGGSGGKKKKILTVTGTFF